MTCTLCRATEDEINRLITDPSAVRGFLDLDGPGLPDVRTVRVKGLGGLILRLLPITITEVMPGPPPDAPGPAENPDRVIDIGKGWHGLHFLFTGTADDGEEPGCFLVRGGEDLDDEGHTRALRADQVRRFAEYLSILTARELTRRYDPERMTELEIYPDVIWMRPVGPVDSPLAWLLDCFAEVRRFMDRAAAADYGVIIDIS